MSNRKKSAADTSSKSGSANIPIIVALIALAGTLLAALITASVNIYQAQLPIRTTQTAEAQGTAVAVHTIIPLLTFGAAAAQPASTLPPTAAPSTTAPPLDWKNLLAVRSKKYCMGPELVLATSDTETGLDQDALLPLAQKAYQNYQQNQYNGFAQSSVHQLMITNIAGHGDVQFQNTFFITVNVQPAPKHADIAYEYYWGCGGGQSRASKEGPVQLDNQLISYKQVLHYDEFEYYQLGPGEAEFFAFNYQCHSPGTYDAMLSIPYTYLGQADTVQYPTKIVCPEVYTGWFYMSGDEYWSFMNPDLFTGLKIDAQYQWFSEYSQYAPR
jgi:hypothetical protein